MIQWNFPVIINHRWVRVTHVSKHANKYEAVLEYAEQAKERGVIVQGHDMSQAWEKWL